VSLRVVFAGTPAFALPSLEATLDVSEVVGVLTAPDAPKGRGRRLTPPPVKEAADAAGIPVLQPERLGADARKAVQRLEPDLLVCAAYGRIFGPKFMALFPQGGVNVHPSLLPRFRGPTPIQATILAGDPEAGVTVQYLAPELDSGDILAQESVSLTGTENYPDLEARLSALGGRLLRDVILDLEARTAVPRPQNHDRAVYCPMIKKEDGRIDWSLSAEQIDRMARAYDPWPGVYTFLDGERLAIKELAVAGESSAGPGTPAPSGTATPEPGCVVGVDKAVGILVQTGQHLIALRRIQPAGRKAMDFLAFANGNPAVREACFD
jgi:methionyl-tRNA formyltransferase